MDFNQPMCEADGTCHEPASLPSPRTVHSAKSKAQFQQWHKFHSQLEKEAKLAAKHEVDVLFLGDSITEAFRGSSLGRSNVSRTRGSPEVLYTEFKQFPNKLVLAVSGDQTQHLLWRLHHGELPPSLQPGLIILHIGTNNIRVGHLPEQVAEGVQQIVHFLSARCPEARIVVNGLFPFVEEEMLEKICPPRCSTEGFPFASFKPAIGKVNHLLRDLIRRAENPRLEFVDCSHLFFAKPHSPEVAIGSNLAASPPAFDSPEVVRDKDSWVNQDLMPDLLHPNAKGMQQWAQCMLFHIEKGVQLLKASPSDASQNS
ncbi:hypothetical protein CYMTET_10640 [Cymbomonas tetramitiformis]|uniref:SGNH hydrolase-type esterase domain-containing protein n=1 Tax=Cymbomonas tetramitiformis TaxID=36881 RepID=A0AAE0GNY9_9CHLO|nr:hypothetical protein CYMTET_10640 [Cymbomonas tetramitiformis]